MKSRIFIIAPSSTAPDEDTMHIVARTTYKHSLRDIYIGDLYKEIAVTDNLNQAVKIARKHGSKRPTII